MGVCNVCGYWIDTIIENDPVVKLLLILIQPVTFTNEILHLISRLYIEDSSVWNKQTIKSVDKILTAYIQTEQVLFEILEEFIIGKKNLSRVRSSPVLSRL